MRTVHASLSVRGALRWDKRRLKRLAPALVVDGRQCRTAEEAREVLLDLLSDGTELLPLGNCEGFDPKTGCPGHEKPGAPIP